MIRMVTTAPLFLLMVFFYQDCDAITTPVGDINNATEIHGRSGGKIASVTFSVDSNEQPQAVLFSIMMTNGHALTASIPFAILNQIHNVNLPGTGNLLPFIPAALATLMLVNNNLVPQLNNEYFQIAALSLSQGTMTLTLSGTTPLNNFVSADMSLSIYTPGEVQVILPGVFLPVMFILNMQPPPPIPLNLSLQFHWQVQWYQQIQQLNPLTGQLEAAGSF